MNNVSFQGHTTLVFNPQKYNEVLPLTLRTSRNLKPSNHYSIRPNYEYTSNSLDNNMIVLVRNENTGFLKFVPITNNNEKILNEISSKVEEIIKMSKNRMEKLTAWIIGGNSIDSKSGSLMIKTLNKIADILCDNPNIDTSILAGSKKIEENIVIHPSRKNFEIFLEKEKGTNLEDVFDIVELNNTDII